MFFCKDKRELAAWLARQRPQSAAKSFSKISTTAARSALNRRRSASYSASNSSSPLLLCKSRVGAGSSFVRCSGTTGLLHCIGTV